MTPSSGAIAFHHELKTCKSTATIRAFGSFCVILKYPRQYLGPRAWSCTQVDDGVHVGEYRVLLVNVHELECAAGPPAALFCKSVVNVSLVF